jgi:hypothetical protein
MINVRQFGMARGALAVAGAFLALLALSLLGGPAAAQTPSGAMALDATGDGVECSGATCTVPLGGDFALEVIASEPPADGYIGIQTQVSFAGLAYNATATAEEEILWPDNVLPLRDPAAPTGAETQVTHGGVSNLTPPYTPSSYDGILVSLSMTCTDAQQTIPVNLVPYTKAQPGATAYSAFVSDKELVTVPASDSLTINCGEPPEPPTPVDGTDEPPDDDGTATPVAQDLPDTGSGAGATNSTGTMAWLLLAALAAGAFLSAGALAWQRSRNR